MKNIIVITGASSGFGTLAARSCHRWTHRLRQHARNDRSHAA